MPLRRLLPLALIAALLVPPAAAAGWQEAPHSRARLIAAGTANADALAGRTHLRTRAQLVGLEVELDPGWKTYWRSPGDGIPPQFEWAGSDNVAAAQVLWPVPTHFRDAAGEYNGYADRVVLPVVVAPKRPGAPVSLDLALDYAVCKDVCIPVSAQLSLRLPDDTPRGRQAVLEALRQVPVRADSRGRCGDLALADARLRFDGPSPRMEITLTHPPGGAPEDLFVEAATGQFMPHPKRQEATAERTVFHLDPSAGGDPRELAGKAMTLTVVAAPQSCEMTATME